MGWVGGGGRLPPRLVADSSAGRRSSVSESRRAIHSSLAAISAHKASEVAYRSLAAVASTPGATRSERSTDAAKRLTAAGSCERMRRRSS